MKKAIILLILLGLSLGAFSCGGGGAGSLDSPPGENPGTASVVQLTPSQNVAQTNASITLSAKVLDGNGVPIPGVAVTFTNLSSVGTLSISSSSAVTSSVTASNSTVATTNGLGIATARVYSTTSGFATIVAQVNTGFGFVRDRRSIFFTSSDSVAGLAFTPIAIEIDVDGDNDGIWNETSDLNVCSASGDNVVRIRATLYIAGQKAAYIPVYFTTDNDITATFPSTPYGTDNDADGDIDIDVVTTNSQGVALSEVTVNCFIQNNERIMNVYAYTDSLFVQDFNGYFSGISGIPLFLQPVTVTGITVTATPSTILTGGTSTIKATVNTSAGLLKGVAVAFSTSCGTVSPTVAQTDANGIATTTFTAPSIVPAGNACTVTAKVGSVTGTATVTVNPPLTVMPSSQTVAAGSTATFTIIGGIPSYTIYSNNSAYPPVPTTVTTSGGTFTVTIPAAATAATVTYTIRDSVGTTATATLTITAATTTSLTVRPSSITVTGFANPDATSADNVTFTITGGTAPYSMFSSNSAVIASAGALGAGVSTFTVDPHSVASSTTVTLTVTDSTGATATAAVTVTPPTSSLALSPSTITMTNGSTVVFYILGGSGPYQTYTSSGCAPIPGLLAAGTTYFNVTVGCSGTFTITIEDMGAGGRTATATITVP